MPVISTPSLDFKLATKKNLEVYHSKVAVINLLGSSRCPSKAAGDKAVRSWPHGYLIWMKGKVSESENR